MVISQQQQHHNHSINTEGVNFLALDFDQTIIDIHTGGRFKGSISDLSSHVRPMFIHLISAAHKAGIKIAIVTFSPQVNYISQVLQIHFPNFYHEIIIRGRDDSWFYEGNGMKHGKQHYMASAVEEIMTKNKSVVIARNTTLLIDDDPKNIQMALSDSVRGILLDPEKSDLLIDDILDMP
jgi:hypothetical protein